MTATADSPAPASSVQATQPGPGQMNPVASVTTGQEFLQNAGDMLTGHLAAGNALERLRAAKASGLDVTNPSIIAALTAPSITRQIITLPPQPQQAAPSQSASQPTSSAATLAKGALAGVLALAGIGGAAGLGYWLKPASPAPVPVVQPGDSSDANIEMGDPIPPGAAQ